VKLPVNLSSRAESFLGGALTIPNSISDVVIAHPKSPITTLGNGPPWSFEDRKTLQGLISR
jgi:hypothetical protein